MNVLCIWDVPKNLRDYFKANIDGDINIIYSKSNTEEDYIKLAKENNVEMIIGWRPSKDLIEASDNLRLVQNPGAGVTHLLSLFKDSEVKLANCHGNSYFTAQHGVALLLSLTNSIVNFDNAVRDGFFRKDIGIRENIPLRNNVIGILGLGHVGQNVAKFLSGFDTKLITCKRSSLDKHYPHIEKVYGFSDIEDFFGDSDIIISTLPLTDLTKGLINKKLLNILGKNGLIVNIGRGDTIVEKDLYNALFNKNIAGAALDVFWNEKSPKKVKDKIYPYNFPFHELENVLLSPHRAASPMSDLKRWDPVIENILRLKEDKPLINLVNVNEGY